MQPKPETVRFVRLVQTGNVHADAGRHTEAIADFRRALRIKPDDWRVHYNIGNSLLATGRLAEALDAFDSAAARNSHHVIDHNRAHVLRDLNRRAEALQAADTALAALPSYHDARYTRACIALALGDFVTGLRDYEARFDCSDAFSFRIAADTLPTWRGEPLAGRHILVHTEQGHGDTFQFIRFLPELVARGARVTLYALGRMHAMLSRLPAPINLVGSMPDDVSRFDYVSPLLSLPLYLGARLDTVPAQVPYLKTDTDRVAHWRERIGSHGLKIGIAWQGNPSNINDASRSFPLACFAPLTTIPGVRLISLQVGAGADQIATMPGVESLGPDFDAGPDAFTDTAAAMQCVDLIVGADSAVIHLAGALGRPVWVPLRFAPDWRWLEDRPDSPWYPTMTLYRQEALGDWAGVFERIARRVADRAMSLAPIIQLPGSVGELIDKRTILEIKAERITDPGKLANVRRELDALRRVEADHVSTCRETVHLAAQLREVNGELWQIEDEIREHELRSDFGPGFVAMARSVYQKNDHRAALKRRLNELHGSAIVEEKQHPTPTA